MPTDAIALEPRRTMVIGGTSGLGRAVVERLAAAGERVAFSGRDVARGEAIAAMTGARFIPGDVRDDAAVRAAFAEAARELGGLDGAVLSAGVIEDAPITATVDEAWDLICDVNITGVQRCARAALEQLDGASGAVVVVASDAGLWGETLSGAYAVSKRAAVTLAQCLAWEVAAQGVRVNALCPGDIVPGMRTTATTARGSGQMDDSTDWDSPPLGRLGQAADIAAATAYLLDPTASPFVAGAPLLVDGGMRAGLRPVSETGTAGIPTPARTAGTPVALLVGAGTTQAAAVEAALVAASWDVFAVPPDRDEVDAALERLARLDALVSCLDQTPSGGAASLEPDTLAGVLEPALTVPLRAARDAFARLRAGGGGAIVCIGSSAGLRPAPDRAAVSVAASGLIGLVEVLAAEGAAHGIHAHAVCPPPTDRVSEPSAIEHAVAAATARCVADAAASESGSLLRIGDTVGIVRS